MIVLEKLQIKNITISAKGYLDNPDKKVK